LKLRVSIDTCVIKRLYRKLACRHHSPSVATFCSPGQVK
jgi:hypothetical protein